MKKERREKLPSRRKRTLRRVLIAAAALLLVNRILLVGLLFPIQAIRRNEERMGTGRTAVVHRERAPEIYQSLLIYLTENENVTMLSGTNLSLYGWVEAFGVPVDCSEEAPIHGGWWSLNRGEEGKNLFYVFGRIDDPDIDFLQITVQHNGEAPKVEDVWQPMGFEWGLEREDFMEKDGRSYFLLEKYPVDWNDYPYGVTVTALGSDKEGNILARIELEQGASSYFG